jgi:hypothetical protein
MLTFAVAWYCVKTKESDGLLVTIALIADAVWMGNVGVAAFS